MLQHLLHLLQYLDRSRFRPLVAGTPEEALVAALRDLDADFRPLPVGQGWHPIGRRRLQRELEGLLRAEGVRLVHTHGVLAGLVARYPAYRAGVRVLVTCHNLIYTRPGWPWRKRLLARWQRRLVPYTDRFIAVCRALAEELRRFEGVPPEKIAVIPNGVDLERLDAVLARGRSLPPPFDRGPVVGTFCRLIPEKGPDLFLKAAAVIARQVPESRFVIAGDGPWRPHLEALARGLGLGGRVGFLGWVEEAAGLLPRLAVYVQASRQEGLSLAVLEAMAARRPVVAFRTGGLAEVIRPHRNGLLVPAQSWPELAQAVTALLRDRGLADRLAAEGRRTVQERYSARETVERTQALYRDLLGRE